ncbi:MAG: hypothetical protein WC746_05375 [archaeon]|jgi:hypothetical protein
MSDPQLMAITINYTSTLTNVNNPKLGAICILSTQSSLIDFNNPKLQALTLNLSPPTSIKTASFNSETMLL